MILIERCQKLFTFQCTKNLKNYFLICVTTSVLSKNLFQFILLLACLGWVPSAKLFATFTVIIEFHTGLILYFWLLSTATPISTAYSQVTTARKRKRWSLSGFFWTPFCVQFAHKRCLQTSETIFQNTPQIREFWKVETAKNPS